MTRFLSTASLALMLMAAGRGSADAAEIHVWTARAFATVLAEIGSAFERATGHTLLVHSGLPAEFERRMAAGEPLDLLITGSAAVDEWIAQGRVAAATRTRLARSGIGVAVRAGAPTPDIRSVEAFKRALLAARSLAYLRVGSGTYVHGLLGRLGVAEAVGPKVTRPRSDAVCELVASGDVELGIVVITQILTTPGVTLAGPLPPEIQSHVEFDAAVAAAARAPDAAAQLIRFLRGPSAGIVIKAQGMEPAR